MSLRGWKGRMLLAKGSGSLQRTSSAKGNVLFLFKGGVYDHQIKGML